MVVGRTPGLLTNLIAVGPSTYLERITANCRRASTCLGDTAIAYPHISLETVVRLNPDVILDMSMMGESGEPRLQEEHLRQSWLAPRIGSGRNGDGFRPHLRDSRDARTTRRRCRGSDSDKDPAAIRTERRAMTGCLACRSSVSFGYPGREVLDSVRFAAGQWRVHRADGEERRW